MFAKEIEIMVLAHPAKECLTAKFLTAQNLPFTLYHNPDWELPADHPEQQETRSEFLPMKGYALRQYRAYRGHQELCRKSQARYTLIFEDDAQPNCEAATWLNLVNQATRFLEAPYGYDAVSLHGRDLSRPYSKQVQLLGRTFVELPPQQIVKNGQLYFLRPVRKYWPQFDLPLFMKWHIGCLAYLIGEEGRKKWIAAEHGGGMPCDLFLVNMLNTLVCEQSPFDHMDGQAGSLIGNSGPCRRFLLPDGAEAPGQ